MLVARCGAYPASAANATTADDPPATTLPTSGATALPASRTLIRKRGVLDQCYRNEKLIIQYYQ